VVLFLEEYRSFKACPNCARRVNPDARVCRFCGYELITYDDFRTAL
jgi:RNA polymerase subunit RPABC4/transcription elongation factor Spt4